MKLARRTAPSLFCHTRILQIIPGIGYPIEGATVTECVALDVPYNKIYYYVPYLPLHCSALSSQSHFISAPGRFRRSEHLVDLRGSQAPFDWLTAAVLTGTLVMMIQILDIGRFIIT